MDDNNLFDAKNFEHHRFEDASVAGLNARGCSFFQCEFVNVKAEKIDFSDSIFEECTFAGCDLTMMRLNGARFTDVQFAECKLMGIDWSVVGGISFSIALHRCMIRYCAFIDLTMRDASIVECDAEDANFSGTDLTGSDFSESMLAGAKFVDANLTRANLSTATDYVLHREHTTLANTRVSQVAALAMVEQFGVLVG